MSLSRDNNPGYAELATASESLAEDYEGSDYSRWAKSPFEWILKFPSRTKGAIGEKLVSKWAESQGFRVDRSTTSDYDRIINGHRIEIKMSTLWATGGFKFQQIREQEYDFCFCLGLMPHDARAWLLSKDLLRQYVIGHLPQHTGSSGTDTFWLGFPAENPLEWMKDSGGTLGDVAEAFRVLGQGPY